MAACGGLQLPWVAVTSYACIAADDDAPQSVCAMSSVTPTGADLLGLSHTFRFELNLPSTAFSTGTSFFFGGIADMCRASTDQDAVNP